MAKAAKSAKVSLVTQEATPLRRNRFEIPNNMVAEVHFHIGDDNFRGNVKAISARGLQVGLESAPFAIASNQHVDKIQVFINNKMVYQGAARVIDENERSGLISFYLYLLDGGYDQKALQSLLSGNQSLRDFLHSDQKPYRHPSIDGRFKSLCSDFLVLLADIEKRMVREMQKFDKHSGQEELRKNLEQQVLRASLDAQSEKLQHFFGEIAELVEKLDVESALNHHAYFRTLFAPIFLTPTFIKNHMQRIQGYSGDYSPISLYYEDIHGGCSLFQRFLWTFLSNEPGALSHQGRVNFLAGVLFERYGRRGNLPHTFKVASLEAGANLEVRQMLGRLQKKEGSKLMELVVVEQEDKTLSHVQQSLRALVPDEEKLSLRTINANVLDAITKPAPYSQNIQNSDLIVVPGLLDNLSDRLGSALIATLYSSLRPGGSLIFGNMAKDQPDHFSINYLFEGARFVRDKSDLMKLVGKSVKDSGAKVQVVEDPLGLYHFLVVEKK